MKTALPIILLVVLAFGVTYITQFTSTPVQKAGDTSAPDGWSGPPIEFPTSQRAYDPTPQRPTEEVTALDLANKYFPGYFEIGTENNFVPFLFRNNRPEPVLFSALVPSCTKCTSARGAPIPTDELDKYQVRCGIGTITGSLVPDLESVVMWSKLYAGLNWHRFDFHHPEDMMTMPAAGLGTPPTPTWGILELSFKITAATPPNPVSAFFDLYNTEHKKLTPQPATLAVMFGGKEPYDIYPGDRDIGELPEGITPRTMELYAYSSTREKENFPPPTLSMGANDPFVTIGPPVTMDSTELSRLAYDISGKGPPVRVRSGYKYAITISREANGKSQDVGRFEKEVFIGSNVTSKTYRLQIRGMVTGIVKLDGGKSKIEFGTYDGSFGKKLTPSPRIISDRSDLELELLTDQCKPNFVQCTLGSPENESGRRSWALQLHINPNEGRSPPWEGNLVFRSKGSNPTIIRIPITGHGR